MLIQPCVLAGYVLDLLFAKGILYVIVYVKAFRIITFDNLEPKECSCSHILA